MNRSNDNMTLAEFRELSIEEQKALPPPLISRMLMEAFTERLNSKAAESAASDKQEGEEA